MSCWTNQRKYGKPLASTIFLHKEIVRNDKDTIKLEVVYGSSSRNNGPRLNDCLYAGPPMTPLISIILIRFRVLFTVFRDLVAVTANIEKAFQDIEISPNTVTEIFMDRWPIKWGATNTDLEVYESCFPTHVCPIHSERHLKTSRNISKQCMQTLTKYEELVNQVMRYSYVDNFASGFQDVQSAMELSIKMKTTLADGALNMRKCTSNSQELIGELRKRRTHLAANQGLNLPKLDFIYEASGGCQPKQCYQENSRRPQNSWILQKSFPLLYWCSSCSSNNCAKRDWFGMRLCQQ